MSDLDIEKQVTIKYYNYKGLLTFRTIVPQSIYFGSTEYHKENQWLLIAFDVAKQEVRHFAVKDIIAYWANSHA